VDIGMSVRSALIGERKVLPALKEAGFTDEEADKWSSAIMGLWRAEDAKEKKVQP
jgi:hypothetical protein